MKIDAKTYGAYMVHVTRERRRQINDLSYSPENDARNGVRHLLQLSLDYLSQGEIVKGGSLVQAALDVIYHELINPENIQDTSNEDFLRLNNLKSDSPEIPSYDSKKDANPSVIRKRDEILYHAAKLINGDRADIYGPPEVSFGRIADLWNAMGFATKIEGPGDVLHRDLNARDVALALTQLKVSRIISSPNHEDSWVDAAGYIGLGAEIALKGANDDNK